MRHNSKRPTEYYTCFYQVPTTLSTLLLLEIKLLATGLASGKASQLLWSYCQQHVVYPSQASEYSRAARFAQHSQHTHDGCRHAILDPPCGSTAHVWPRTPSRLLPQTSSSALKRGKAKNSPPAPCHTAGLPGVPWGTHRGQLWVAACSIPEGWKLSHDVNHTQPRCPWPRALVACQLSKIYFAQCDTCSPGRLKKQKKHVSRRAEILLSVARACAVFLVKPHTELLLLIFQK